MANRNTYPVWGIAQENVIVPGQFTGNGASAIDNSLNVGRGFSVSRTGAGAYRITLFELWRDIVFVGAVRAATAVDLTVKLVAVSSGTATRLEGGISRTVPVSLVDIEVTVGATPTDLTTAQGIHFVISCRNSAVGPNRGG